MRKSIKALLAALGITAACIGSIAIAACGGNSGTGGEADTGRGTGHVADRNPLGGEDLLDDGGAINSSDDIFVFTGVEYEGEHQIVIGQNSAQYTFTGMSQTSWSNSGASFGRAQTKGVGQYITFALDFSGVENKANIGCKINLISTRGSILISVSRDNENWIDIGYNTNFGLCSDYAEHVEELRGTAVSDNNLYAEYYALGGYIGNSDKLYLRCGFSQDYFQGANKNDNAIGADIIDHISYFDALYFKGGLI